MTKPVRPEPVALTIESVGAEGDGIARLGGERVFVPFTLPGERIVAEIVGRRSTGLVGRAREWDERSPERADPPCPQFGTCGGCSLQHWSDAAYAAWKIALLREGLKRQKIEAPIALLCRTPPGRRRRAGLVALFGKNQVRVGFRERASHRVVAVARCPVLLPELESLAVRLPDFFTDLAVPGEEWSLDVTRSDSGIDLVVTSAGALGLEQRERLAATADQLDLARVTWRTGERGQIEPIAIRRAPSVVFAGVSVELPPGGFLQASAEGEAALVREVLAMTADCRQIADLYAGLGTFTFPLAEAGAEVTAIERDGAAVAALGRALGRSPLGRRIRTACRDLARDPPSAAELGRFDAVVFDPPRAGARALAASLAASAVPRVVAVSCEPSTFARDAHTLVSGGYRLDRLVPVDQFLWSSRLELVASFRR